MKPKKAEEDNKTMSLVLFGILIGLGWIKVEMWMYPLKTIIELHEFINITFILFMIAVLFFTFKLVPRFQNKEDK